MAPDKPVFTVCLKGFPGADRALVELDRATGLTRHVTIASTNPGSPEILFLAELLRERRPRLLVFGGWSPVYADTAQEAAALGIRTAVYWTSSGGQTDISEEIPKLADVLASPAIDRVLFSAPGMAESLRRAGIAGSHLPLTLTVPDAPLPQPPFDVDGIGISLFCPPAEYKRKNVLNSLLALGGVSGRFTLILNGLSEHPSYRTILDTLRVPFRELGWMDRPQYEASLPAVGLGLQLSFAESYDYVAAEHLARGIPVLASPMVPVMRLLSEDVQRHLVVGAADDALAIRRHIQCLVDSPGLAADLGARARDELTAANDRCVAAARETLQGLLDGRVGPE